MLTHQANNVPTDVHVFVDAEGVWHGRYRDHIGVVKGYQILNVTSAADAQQMLAEALELTVEQVAIRERDSASMN